MASSKPDSVSPSHLSKLPTRGGGLKNHSGGQPSNLHLFGIAPEGGCRACQLTLTAGRLLPYRFTLTCPDKPFGVATYLKVYRDRRSSLCCPFRKVSPACLSAASCPMESGLSSPVSSGATGLETTGSDIIFISFSFSSIFTVSNSSKKNTRNCSIIEKKFNGGVMFRKLLTVLVFLSFIGISTAGDEIVYIDIQKVVSESTAGKEAQSLLENEAKEFQKELQKKQEAGESQTELQAFAAEKQQELMKKRQELAEKFMSLLQQNILKFSKEKGYALVVDKQSLLYANPKYDKTEEFLQYFNKNYKKGSLKN